MSEEGAFHSAWDDPKVQAALESRDPGEISLVACQRCGNFGYYNDGSHFTCHWCDWSIGGEAMERLIDNGEVITLEDLDVYEPDGP